MKSILMTPGNASLLRRSKKWATRRLVKADGDECRYGGPGDLLWVRENWQLVELPFADQDPESHIWKGPAPKAHPGGLWHVVYQADHLRSDLPRWRPSIHIPKWAARFILKIHKVHKEPLHAIDDAGAQEEGMRDALDYRELWEEINGRGSWRDNPEVWVIRYTKTEPHLCQQTQRPTGSVRER